MTPASTSFKEDSTIRAIYGAAAMTSGTIVAVGIPLGQSGTHGKICLGQIDGLVIISHVLLRLLFLVYGRAKGSTNAQSHSRPATAM